MTDHQVAALFIAGRHAIAGALDHSSSRVLDVLNNASTEFLHVQQASVFRGVHGAPIGEFGEITIPKSSIDCLLLTEERHEAPLQRKYAHVEKNSHAAFVLLEEYELRGQVMLGRVTDPIILLGSTASHFFPIVSASVASPEPNSPKLNASVVFVNKNKVAVLHIAERACATVTPQNS